MKVLKKCHCFLHFALPKQRLFFFQCAKKKAPEPPLTSSPVSLAWKKPWFWGLHVVQNAFVSCGCGVVREQFNCSIHSVHCSLFLSEKFCTRNKDLFIFFSSVLLVHCEPHFSHNITCMGSSSGPHNNIQIFALFSH